MDTPTSRPKKYESSIFCKMSKTNLNSSCLNISDPNVNRMSTKLQGDISYPPLVSTPTTATRQLSTKTPECYKSVDVNSGSSDTLATSGKISKIEVAVRIRPMNVRELNTSNCKNVVNFQGNNLIVQIYSGNDPTNEIKHSFHYDYVLPSYGDPADESYATQEVVYNKIGKPLVDETFKGYNACLLAYGQTGSGKSYSMMGEDNSVCEINIDSGIIPRFCKDLFDQINSLDKMFTTSVEVSYFEIYNEKIHDLLLINKDEKTCRSGPLKVREHPELGPYVVDLSIHPVNSYSALYSWILIGNKKRTTASTLMNCKSSRSHSIFNIVLTISASKDSPNASSRRSKISFVDLAGSERIGSMNISSTTDGEERLRQGVCINRSLLALSKVIAALSEQPKRSTVNNHPHIPYRESVLTWLLRENLGGNSRTCMLATITPASCHLEETLSTLRYASKARNIVNRIRINEDQNERLIRELRAEIEVLRAMQQEYQRQSLNKSNESSRLSLSEVMNNVLSKCTVENVKGRFIVQLQDFKQLEPSLKDEELDLQDGDKLIITGGKTVNIEKRKDMEPSEENKASNILDKSTTISSECIIENINGRFYVQVHDFKQNETIIDDQLYIKNGDRLIITGGDAINVEKREIYSDSDDEESEEDENKENLSNNTLNRTNEEVAFTIDDLNNSIAQLEKYCNILQETTKVCSTPDSPNDVSQFRSNFNFLEELENILSRSPTKCCLASPNQIRTIFNNSNNFQKKSARKKDNVFRYIKQLQSCSQSIFINYVGEDRELTEAVKYLDNAIERLNSVFQSRRKCKTVRFCSENNSYRN